MCTYMNQEEVIDVCAFPVLFMPLIFLRDLLPPDSCMCAYVNYYLDGSCVEGNINRNPLLEKSRWKSQRVMSEFLIFRN